MRQFLLYGHGGAYNHGAEAIVKTTIKLIREKYDNAYIAISSHFTEQDREFMIDADKIFAPDAEFWKTEKCATSQEEKEKLARLMYADALNAITTDTTLLSVGGDNFCYPNWHRLSVFQQEALRKNAKSILWGCSVEPSLITPAMVGVLNSYTCILARESRTYNALKKCLVTQVCLLPDPAFLLESVPVKLPEGFHAGRIIGINLSPLVIRREAISGVLLENMRNLIYFILSETDMSIALIPHVTMSADNDYEVLSELLQSLPERHRMWLVDKKYSATEYKSIISKCRLLVCARTHASIAAYSSGIPALVIGYSIKSVGIAEDLGMSEFVLDIAEMKSPEIIRNLCRRILANKTAIKNILNTKMTHYIKQTEKYMEYI